MQGSKGDADIKNRHRLTVGKGEGGMTSESSTELYTSPYVKCIASGNLLYEVGNTKQMLCDNRVGEGGGGKL